MLGGLYDGSQPGSIWSLAPTSESPLTSLAIRPPRHLCLGASLGYVHTWKAWQMTLTLSSRGDMMGSRQGTAMGCNYQMISAIRVWGWEGFLSNLAEGTVALCLVVVTMDI